MTEQTQEPTMEEILASIRRIISEDEPGQTAAPEAGAPAVDELAPVMEPFAAPDVRPEPVAFAPEPTIEEEPLDLTQRFEEPAVEAIGDIEAAPFPTPEPEPAPATAPEPAFVAPIAAAITSDIGGGLTVEAMVRSIVEPQVQAWLSQNLDGLLREMLREKLERVFR